ncbi:MAG: histidine phosphatase family protein [SAR202 cluster bacterium]|nr:histidine phosphatase family protein [SAR202 cluster bacterium]
MRLILARHGETQLNKDGQIQGLGGTPLNATGNAQAHALAGYLEADLPFALYSSPVARALETAVVVSETLRVPLTTLSGLREADAGDLEGLTGEEMRQRYSEFAEHWSQDSGSTQMPGGESLSQVQQRAWAVVTDLMSRHAGDTVVAVTHNFTIQTVICRVLEMSLHHGRRLKQDLGSVSRLDLSDSQVSLASLNETWHLRSLRRTD